MNTIERPAASAIPPLKPGRKIEGISAVLLPYKSDDQPDWEGFRRLLERTWNAGLTPAVNMDTGYVNLLTPAERERALGETAEVSRSRRFVAGAFIEGDEGDPAVAYLRAVNEIRARGGIPILFQSSALGECSEQEVLDAYARVARSGGPLLAFELGRMFAPFGRIYSDDFFRRLLDIEAFTGLKHSSLDRELEWRRLQMRDRHRPGFKVYTGNDLAIDMVFYGSDYLLGLSAFAVDAFALRDRLWAENDSSAVALNDLLQYLGQLAFRSPVPAYKHSAAQFLKLRGFITTDRPHPRSPRRPDSDIALLRDIRERLDADLTALSANRIA
ncbi:MAG TPA: dihydrodipicolinate synthase family protein [Vicinamibacterales bacterium]|jgi:dihydrodipicolinate synthase/N-acetylneuraminate lyase|nr:dihydrodipicolinate synthase family protein [Vicinamibacterales bacterium]